MSGVYRSPFEAYPYLSDSSGDLRCDFELMTDELASGTGMLRALVISAQDGFSNPWLCDELSWVCELIYHLNPTLRTFMSVTQKECDWLERTVERLREEVGYDDGRFVVPVGVEAACQAHLLRVQAKKIVRLLYRYAQQGNEVPELLFDIFNLLSAYFFYMALNLNIMKNVPETPFESRNYDT